MNTENSERKYTLDGETFSQPETIGKLMSVDEVMMEISKDCIFYDESEGGVTFSGGEPLMQHRFLTEVIDQCRKQNIHTTVDTCGYASIEVMEKIADHSDLLLYDLKHMNNAAHLEYTGVSNAKIINNLIWLDANKKNVIIRYPVIPQINDNKENIDEMLDFLKKLKHIKRLTLLPYHTIAGHKYVQLKKENKMNETKSLSNSDLEYLKIKIESIGFDVKIGN
jgi:pyruvate formate lyase activating enzyme